MITFHIDDCELISIVKKLDKKHDKQQEVHEDQDDPFGYSYFSVVA